MPSSGFRIREELPHLGGDETGRDPLLHGTVAENEVDDVGPGEVRGDAHERLEPVVVSVRIEVVLRAIAAERVEPGPGTGRSDDVGLRVLIDPEREELHELPCEVLVRAALFVRVVVEPDEHRGLERHLLHQITEVARRHRAEERVLLVHQPGVIDLVVGRREVSVPEERQLLLERGGRRGHPIQPPGLELELLLPIPDVRREERGRRVGGCPGEVEELVDSGRPILGRQRCDLRRGAAEAGSPEQMCDVGRLWHRSVPPLRGIPGS